MQITMKESELEVAVRDFIKKMGIDQPIGSISFIAKRGEGEGITTTVEVGEREAVVSGGAPGKNVVTLNGPAPDEKPGDSVEAETEADGGSIFG